MYKRVFRVTTIIHIDTDDYINDVNYINFAICKYYDNNYVYVELFRLRVTLVLKLLILRQQLRLCRILLIKSDTCKLN